MYFREKGGGQNGDLDIRDRVPYSGIFILLIEIEKTKRCYLE
jgi:hypothetical protein